MSDGSPYVSRRTQGPHGQIWGVPDSPHVSKLPILRMISPILADLRQFMHDLTDFSCKPILAYIFINSLLSCKYYGGIDPFKTTLVHSCPFSAKRWGEKAWKGQKRLKMRKNGFFATSLTKAKPVWGNLTHPGFYCPWVKHHSPGRIFLGVEYPSTQNLLKIAQNGLKNHVIP